MDLASVAGNPAWWPKQIVLTRSTAFPIVSGGNEIGTVQVPAGMPFRLTQVTGAQVEVEFQERRHWIRADSTDVLARAAAIARLAPVTAATPSAKPETPASTEPTRVSPTPSASPETALTGARSRFEDRVSIEVVRNRKMSNLTGYYDPRDTVSFKVKMSNSDPSTAFENLTGEIYAFASSLTHRTQYKLLGSQPFQVSLPVRGNYDFVSKEMAIYTDTAAGAGDSGSIYHGFKFEGWLLRIVDSAGQVVARKASSPVLLKLADKAPALSVGEPFDRSAPGAGPGK